MFDLIGLDSDVSGSHGDIRDLESLSRAMTDFAPDIVIHMAAQPLVRRSYVEPVETFSTNVLGTVNVMEAVRRTPSVQVMVNVTSDKCYENTEAARPFRESDPMGGSDPYSASKGCAELAASAWNKSFFQDGGPAMVSVRAGNVIGGGDFGEDRLLPDMVRAYSRGKLSRFVPPRLFVRGSLFWNRCPVIFNSPKKHFWGIGIGSAAGILALNPKTHRLSVKWWTVSLHAGAMARGARWTGTTTRMRPVFFVWIAPRQRKSWDGP